MDNQSNTPPPDPPFPDFPAITHDVSLYSREERKKLRVQLKDELHRVRAMIKTVKIRAAKIKTPKIKNFKIEAGSQVQNVLPQKLLHECEEIFKKLGKYQHCKHLNQPVVVEGIVGEPIGLNEIADRFKGGSYKSPHQFADDMRSACNRAMNYNKRDEVVKVASRILDKVNEKIKPILEDWKKLGAVDNEEIAMDVDAGLGEKSDNTLLSTGDIAGTERDDDAGDMDYSDMDSDDALG